MKTIRGKQKTETAVRADNRPIGVFDSGLGGLTVVSALRKMLPSEDLIYLGDTARVPYGNRSIETICEFAGQDVDFLVGKGVKAVVAACNTVSAVALDGIRARLPELPILGVIESGVSAAIRTGGKNITVLGTRATINSDSYRRALHAVDASLVVRSVACPLFVPLAEEGETGGKLARDVFDLYLREFLTAPPDVLLLGCTHYPLFKNALAEYMPAGVRIVDSALAAAEHVGGYLSEHGMSASAGKSGEDRYYVTDFSGNFHRQAQLFLGWRVTHVEKVNL